MKNFVYISENKKEISFPLGGIGSGCIGVSGNGLLRDFEIFNKPNKNSFNGFTFMTVKAEDEKEVLDVRVLHGDELPPYMGETKAGNFFGYGFGVNRSTLASCPHFEENTFEGKFPFAKLNFTDKHFPADVQLTAFNPFIPLDDKNSSLPAAFFEVEFDNTTNKELTYTVAFSCSNPEKSGALHISTDKSIHLKNTKFTPNDVEYGDMCILTDATDTCVQEYWYRGTWFDSLNVFWQDFSKFGKLQNRDILKDAKVDPNFDRGDTATLASSIKLQPNTSGKIRFVLSWYYPNCHNYWTACDCNGCCKPKIWKNYYGTQFESSNDCGTYCLEHYDDLKDKTSVFADALFSQTLPDSVTDAISANISILKTPTCLRLADGSFYGFEGCHCESGCCEGSCTHVWNYAYALPFLFPKLERSMRELDYKYNMDENGGMSFRLQLPIGSKRSSFRPCVDGQFGGIIKTYRDWKISGDDEWLKGLWDSLKKNMEFTWSPNNPDKWDINKTGVLHGRQHHTLDMELFGPNSWLTGFYLAALKAMSEMAQYLGEDSTLYTDLFVKGKKWVEENLFNGEYFYHKIDVSDKTILDDYEDAQGYWNDEALEIKYQISEGSAVDQVVAQWHANICGLGEIFNKDMVTSSLKSIYKYNFIKDMRNFFNPCRVYCLNDEKGTVICNWPTDSKKPVIPVPYSQETMHGFEYQAAIHMLQDGMVSQGIELIEAVRDRYDGHRRNPWNEIECGSNYARSMASYAALLAFSGFSFNMPKGEIGFNPIVEGDCKYFWSLDSGWGTFERVGEIVILRMLYGTLKIKNINLPFMNINSVSINDNPAKFGEFITLTSGDELKIFGNFI